MAQPSPAEERLAHCLSTVAMRDAICGRKQSKEERRVEAEGMALHCQEIPAHLVLEVMRQLLDANPNYPPSAVDVLRHWRGESLDNNGRNLTVANAAAYQPWSRPQETQPESNEPSPSYHARKAFMQRLAQGRGGVDCHCKGDHFRPQLPASLMSVENMAKVDHPAYRTEFPLDAVYWVCRTGSCDFICENTAEAILALPDASPATPRPMMDQVVEAMPAVDDDDEFEGFFTDGGDQLEVEIAA